MRNLEEAQEEEKKVDASSKPNLWRKEGDFSLLQEPLWTVERNFYYTCQSNSRTIQILGYKNREIALLIKMKQVDQEFCANLKKHGFPEPSFLDVYNGELHYSIIIQSTEFLESLLGVVMLTDDSVREICDEIIGITKPYLINRFTIPGWIKSGSFSFCSNPDNWLNRSQKYESIQANKIKELSLLGYKDSTVVLRILTTEDKFNLFFTEFTKEIKNCEKGYLSSITVNIQDSKYLATLLEVILTLDPSASPLLVDDMLTTYDHYYISSLKKAFFMGYHPRLGQNSPIFLHLKGNAINEPKLAMSIFSFLSTPSVKKKNTETQQSKGLLL